MIFSAKIPLSRRTILITAVSVVALIVITLFVITKVKLTILVQRNANDTLMLLAELATETGFDHIRANTIHAEMLQKYTEHMEQRPGADLLRCLHPELSPKRQLAHVAADLRMPLSQADEMRQQMEAREKSQAATVSVHRFLTRSNQSSEIRIAMFGPEFPSPEVLTLVIASLNESHEQVEKYANNEQRTVDDAIAVCISNRKVIVYLYLVRFGYQRFIPKENLQTLRTDIDRSVYYNRRLQKRGPSETGEVVNADDYELLDKCSASEIQSLRLLQAIIDNNIQETRSLLQDVIGHKE